MASINEVQVSIIVTSVIIYFALSLGGNISLAESHSDSRGLQGRLTCEQFFVGHSRLDPNLQLVAPLPLAHQAKEVLAELARLSFDAKVAFASGQADLASQLYSLFKVRYREAQAESVDLQNYSSLLDEIRETSTRIQDKQDELKEQAIAADRVLWPWEMSKTLNGHTGWVNNAKFSRDSLHILTNSVDHTAMIWDQVHPGLDAGQ
jgi:WD40 repeat protein